MKTLLVSLAVSAAAITSPAAAQYPSDGYQNRGDSYRDDYRDDDRAGANMAPRIEQMRVRIQAGVQSGAISREEAVSLRANLRSLTQLERQYSRGGLTNQERQGLQARLRALRQDVRRAEGGANGRYDDWDRQNDRDDDRYDSRSDGPDGRWNDDDRDDDYRQPPQRGGIGGLIDNVLGRNEATLQVGQRAPSNLYGVPYEYRDRYRDTSRSYYRSDGRQIYQIDARTQAVVRIHTMNR